jgi:two-component system response regulator DevR
VNRNGLDDPRGMSALNASRPVIRIAVVDDHAAVRMGLEAAIGAWPGFVCVGTASDGDRLEPLLYRTRPDVVILDYRLPRTDGLWLCRRIKSQVPTPRVLLYSAYADPALVVPAMIAGADGIVDKSAPARELREAVHAVATGASHLPAPIPELLQAAGEALPTQDRPILRLLVAFTPRREIAARLDLSRAALEERIGCMLDRLSGPARRSRMGLVSRGDDRPCSRTPDR